MDWVFWALVGASVIHILEEYKYPGGFLLWLKAFLPRLAPSITAEFALRANAVFLTLCIAGALVADRNLFFSLSVAGLLGWNALLHLIGTFVTRHYSPGVISGIVLYFPLTFLAYYLSISSGRFSFSQAIGSGLLGMAYQAVPLGYFVLTSRV